MKAVLFARVSSREQEETGYSLPAQEKLLRSYAEKNNFTVAKTFSISESASGRRQRAVFSEMLKYLQKRNLKIIVCEKVDRLTRNFKDAVLIDEWLEEDAERQVHLVKDSLVLHQNSRSQEKFNWGIRIIFAKNYIDNLSEEVKKGQVEKIAQGWLPTKPPPGYKTVGEAGHKVHVVDEEKASLIRKLFELYASGEYSLTEVTKKVLEMGLTNSVGGNIVRSNTHRILTNPFYKGKIFWNGKLYPGSHEPLVSDELFDRVQQLLVSKTTPKYRKHMFLFKSLIRCGECGGLITWEVQKRHVYGHCNGYRACSDKTWVKEPKVEEQLVEGFQNLQLRSPRLVEWIRKALKESHKDEIAHHSSSLKQLQEQLERVQNRLDKLYDDKLDERIPKEFYERKFEQYTEEKETLLTTIKRHETANTKYYRLGLNIYDLSQRAKELYRKAELAQKRQFIRFVFNNLKIRAGILDYQYTPAFKLLYEAVNLTNRSKQLKAAEKEERIFEPTKWMGVQGKTGVSNASRPAWLRGRDSNPDTILQRDVSYH